MRSPSVAEDDVNTEELSVNRTYGLYVFFRSSHMVLAINSNQA